MVVKDRTAAPRGGAFRAALAVGGACLTCLAVGACGGGGGDPLADMSGKQVVDKAVGDLKSASSFSLAGTVSDSGGDYTVHLDYKPGTGCKGTVAQAGHGSFAMVMIGTTAWLKPDNAFWRAYAGSDAAAAIALLGGRYLKGSTSNANLASLTKLCDVNALASSLSLPTDVVKGKVTTVGGEQVLPLTDKAKGGTMYVTDTSSPQIVELVKTAAGDSGKISFTVGHPVTVTAPPASQSVDGSPFGL
jgi:hypothetical protein